MDNILEFLNLSSNPAPADWLGMVSIFILSFFGITNLVASRKGDKQVEDKSVDIKTEPPLVDEEAEEKAVVKVVESQKTDSISWTRKLSEGLSKTRVDIFGKISNILTSSDVSDDEYEQIEEILFSADLPPILVDELLEKLKNYKKEHDKSPIEFIRDYLSSKLTVSDFLSSDYIYKYDPNNDMKVIMIVGVNGAGKTTTIGKLATRLKKQGAKVVVGACDTFRAAAVEQLEQWCKRAEVEMVRAPDNADPSGVAFDTVAKAKEMGADYCIIDTAGRLHTASNLMDELAKTKKVMSKVVDSAPHMTLLVIDAITGQNALKQAEEFNKSLNLDGLIFTKCDGSSKAGSAVGIVDRLQVPIAYIGVGEGVEDIDHFDTNEYLNALLGT